MTRSQLLPALAAFLMGTPVRAADSSLTAQFAEPLADALLSIAMSPADLTFRTDHVDRDSFRLSLMDRVFREPVSALDRVSAMSAAIGKASTPADLADVAAPWLDLVLGRVGEGAETPFPLADTSRFDSAMALLWSAMTAAEGTVRGAFARLSPAEVDSLSAWATAIMSEEGDGEDGGAGVDIFALRRAEHAERERARWHLALAERVDRAALLNAAWEVYRAAWRVRDALLSMSPEERGTMRTTVWETSFDEATTPGAGATFGKVAIGGSGRDRYTGYYALIVDVGGDDEYELAPPDSALSFPVQVIIDASGNDRYEGRVGAGMFGVGLLLDLTGDDTYRAGIWSQGAGCFGVGVLWDEVGNDFYSAGSAAQGVGAFGIGALVDLAGRDVYQVGNYGQAVGATAGVGILEERGGHDSYLSGGTATDLLRYSDHYLTMTQGVGLGVRPVASGGIGLLSDRWGNDTYAADIFGQGAAYWLGIGGLVDEQGHDRYMAYQYAQGSGVHLAAGVLIDREGHDVYASNGVSQGCGHDLSVGILFDGSGDDSYTTEGLSLGAGNANGISLFVDMSGRDGYIARRGDVLGYSDERREYGMIGVMLDLGGEDRYGAPYGEEGGWWTHSTYGVGVDRSWSQTPPAPRQPDAGIGKTPEQIAGELCQDPDSLFVQASNPVAAYQYLVEPAEERLAARGAELSTFWAGKLGSESARERHALVRVHQKLFAKGDTADVPMLLDSLRSSEGRTRRMAAHLLGFSGTKRSVMPLADLLDHLDWQTREMAAQSLWRLSDKDAEPKLVAALGDSVALVRHAAALALEKAGTSRSDSALVGALGDPSQIVRHSAERALAAHPESLPRLADLVMSDTTFASLHALRALRAMADTAQRSRALPALLHALGETIPWPIRAEAAATIAAWRMEEALPALQNARASASHPYLVKRLDAAISALTDAAPAGEQ